MPRTSDPARAPGACGRRDQRATARCRLRRHRPARSRHARPGHRTHAGGPGAPSLCAGLALQPLDSFAGFTKIDQFREAATRYQLNALSYSLSMAQFTRTPAFTGYLAEAQRNATG